MYTTATELAPGIKLYEGVFTESSLLINRIEKTIRSTELDWYAATVNGPKGPTVDVRVRDVRMINIPIFESEPDKDAAPLSHIYYDLYNEITPNIFPVIEEYKKEYLVDAPTPSGLQILKYGPEQHFVDHIDDSPKRTRRLSYVYYVNDDYAGGEISFNHFNLTLKPLAHQLLVFPSNYIYRHKVHPVIQGIRYSMVQWWS
jgi:hypothetical protein